MTDWAKKRERKNEVKVRAVETEQHVLALPGVRLRQTCSRWHR